MKSVRKSLSIIIALFMFLSAFSVLSVGAAAEIIPNTEKVEEKPQSSLLDVDDAVPENAETRTLRFYMPEEWRNTYNDSYDGENLSSCTAGVYWWDSSYSPKTVYGETRKDWPGYTIHETDPADSNIFVAKIPTDVKTIIFNNTVDGGNYDDDIDRYNAAFQTPNMTATHYLPYEDGYGFYPNGTEDCDSMILLCYKTNIEIFGSVNKFAYNCVWFYYYGDGKYGYYKTLEEAEQNSAVYSNGDFPASPVVEPPSTEPVTEKPTEATAPSTSTIQKPVVKPQKANPVKVSVSTKTVKAKKLMSKKQTVKAIKVKKAQGKVTYKIKSVPKKLKKFTKISSKGVITIKKWKKAVKGTYTIKVTIKAAGNASYKPKTVTKNVKIKIK